MKHITVRRDLALIFSPLLLIIGIVLFCFFPTVLRHCVEPFWLSTFIAFLLIITPAGKHALEDVNIPTERPPLMNWFCRILLIEVTLTGLYVGITTLIGISFPINAPPYHTLLSSSLHTLFLQGGLFPWPLYALITVGMGVVAYRQKKDAFFSQLIHPITQKEIDHGISLIVNVSFKRLTLFGLSITLMLMSLLLLNFFMPIKKYIAHGFHPVALVATLILLFISFSDKIKKYIDLIFSRRFGAFLMFPIFIITIGCTVLVVSIAASILAHTVTPTSPPRLIANWIGYDWHTAWIIFSVLWWCAWTAPIASYFTRISKGYSVRTVMIGILIAPIFTGILFFIHPITLSSISVLGISLFSLISFFILLPICINHTNSCCTILSYFPKSGLLKYRNEQFFFRRIAQLTLIALYFYLVIGSNGLSLLVFAPNYCMLIFLLMASVAVFFQVLSRKE